MKIEIHPERDEKKYSRMIKATVDHFFLDKKINPETVVSFNFVSKTKIRTLNKKYRQIDQETDVLSFPIWENLTQIPKKGTANLGDVFICLSVLRLNAQKEGKDETEELQGMIDHSLNHLVGKHH
ncbi:MAG: rRNA maturation RNase YbeY [Patescibacteria group bacterium]|nr:rRNA maturation RNase YbeY [Patescibacteria group bacterium]